MAQVGAVTPPTTVAGGSQLVPTQTPKRIALGGVVLSLNPQQITEKLTRQVVYLPAMNGSIRTDFGNGPREWTLAGLTGQGGVTALLALKKLEAAPGKPQAPVPFSYPSKYGSTVFKVYVDDCQWDESTSNGSFSYYFTLQLREVSALSSQPPIIKVAAPTR